MWGRTSAAVVMEPELVRSGWTALNVLVVNRVLTNACIDLGDCTIAITAKTLEYNAVSGVSFPQ